MGALRTAVRLKQEQADARRIRSTVSREFQIMDRRGRIVGVVDREKSTGNEVVAMITGVNEKSGEASAFA